MWNRFKLVDPNVSLSDATTSLSDFLYINTGVDVSSDCNQAVFRLNDLWSICNHPLIRNNSMASVWTRCDHLLFNLYTSSLPPCSQCLHHELSASENPPETLVIGSGEQWQISWFTVDQSRPPPLPDPLETRYTSHATSRWGKYHLQGQNKRWTARLWHHVNPWSL